MTRLKLCYLTSADIPFADSLRASAGWSQTPADWQRFLDLSPRGCLLAESEGRPIATVTTLTYGHELGWIGMMLVHPEFRRRGIARVLMQHAIEILRSAGVKCIKLDATPAGREVYLGMGFKDEYTITRFEHGGFSSQSASPGIRPAQKEDLSKIIELDHAATGVERKHLLTRLIADSAQALVVQTEREITAYGILRLGSIASYLGPIVAINPSDGEKLASALANGRIFCDLPDQSTGANAWAKSQNFLPQRTLTRMYLGENIKALVPATYFAIAAPELG
jgi:GNAT superfamily N-acetyltransferase